MENFLVDDTPEKIVGFTTAALFSMAFLFSVSVSNASFERAEYSLPDPFAPANVVSVIDRAAASYSNALMEFVEPTRQAFSVHMEQISWIGDEASGPIAQFLDLEEYNGPQVAGAFTQAESGFTVSGSSELLNVDSLLLVLLGD